MNCKEMCALSSSSKSQKDLNVIVRDISNTYVESAYKPENHLK